MVWLGATPDKSVKHSFSSLHLTLTSLENPGSTPGMSNWTHLWWSTGIYISKSSQVILKISWIWCSLLYTVIFFISYCFTSLYVYKRIKLHSFKMSFSSTILVLIRLYYTFLGLHKELESTDYLTKASGQCPQNTTALDASTDKYR